MLTVQEYERYKKILEEANKKKIEFGTAVTMSVKRLKEEYGLTPEEAEERIELLSKELPKEEAELERKFKAFEEKWKDTLQRIS